MGFGYFTEEQLLPLYLSLPFIVLSVFLFHKYEKPAVGSLFLGALGLGYFMANLDPFLILWDEQYHALVAKNMSDHPLKPMLYAEPVLPFDYRDWTANHIWLHKQPLFLWQMALSIELFGNNELAVRLPSVIMHAIIPLFLYRIGKIALSPAAGFYGALFFACAYFPLELIVGRYSTDHNDVAFMFYFAATFWAWFEYRHSGKKYRIVLVGILSGMAVLVKWLLGLFIFPCWALVIFLSEKNNRFRLKTYLPAVYAFLISLLVFLPWQIFIHMNYPAEAGWELQLNARHFHEAIEGHSQPLFYHFDAALKRIYGSGFLIPFLLLAGLIALLIRSKNKAYRWMFAVVVVLVYVFYTAAATKMLSFTIVLAPFIYLGLGALIEAFLSWLTSLRKMIVISHVLKILLPLYIVFMVLNLSKISNSHTMWKPNDNHNRAGELLEMSFIDKLPELLPHDDYVIFNAGITVNGHIPLMFYTDFVAYDFIPTEEQIRMVREKGKEVAVFDLHGLPEYIHHDDRILKLDISKQTIVNFGPPE